MAETPHRGSNTRTKARKRALDILFEADLRSADPVATLDERTADADPPIREYTAEIVRGVFAARSVLDAQITGGLSAGWSLARMPRVDRNLARIALWEISTGLDARVAISQAQLLAAELSTDDSPDFLGGLLGAVTA